MKINTYLRLKYGSHTPTTITAKEARILGIAYPLQSGWLDEHGLREITVKQANQICEVLSGRSEPFAAKGIEVLREAFG